jgi:hypothetical protein
MTRVVLVISLAAILFLAVPPAVRAHEEPELGDAIGHLAQALTQLGIGITAGVLMELHKTGEQIAREHLDVESWHGPALEPDEYVGGFNFKVYPKGKSKSEEHFKAETYYRRDNKGLKEFEFSTSRQEKNSASPSP